MILFTFQHQFPSGSTATSNSFMRVVLYERIRASKKFRSSPEAV